MVRLAQMELVRRLGPVAFRRPILIQVTCSGRQPCGLTAEFLTSKLLSVFISSKAKSTSTAKSR